MNPDYRRAAEKALETIAHYNVNTEYPDPAAVLYKMRNVAMIPYSADCEMLGDNQDAFTLVNRENGKLQYIIIYNQGIAAPALRLALSRELGHIVMEHDGSSPESVWYEEALCFAYHFLCPLPLIQRNVPVNYRPKRHCLSWEMKEAVQYKSIDDMKYHIVHERNAINRYVRNRISDYRLADIALLERCDYEKVTGWKNCYDVVLNGEIIGHCGE